MGLNPVMQTEQSDRKTRPLFFSAVPLRGPGQPISQIVSQLKYVHRDVKITDLVDGLASRADIEAVGVVDDDMNILGIIVQKDLLSLTGRAYGRAIYGKQTAGDLAAETLIVDHDANVFSVSERIDSFLKRPGTNYFLVRGKKNDFEGIFSTKDMLIFLSDLTRRDIEMARELQKRIVKEKDYFSTDRFEIAGSSQPALGIGGDFWAVKHVQGTRWLFALCDVSGKGVAASVITSLLWGMMNSFDFRRGLRSFLRILNDYLVNTFNTEKYVTGLFMDFDEANRSIVLADLGHSLFRVFRSNRFLRPRIANGNPPLGILADIDPVLHVLRLKPEDILFALTDGVVEQSDENGLSYPLERIETLMREYAHAGDLQSLQNRLLADLESFRGRQHVHDDITFFMLRCAGRD